MPDDAIGVDGKTVRCKRCGESWHVRGEAMTPDALELEDLQDAVVEMPSQPPAPAPIGSKAMRAKADTSDALDLVETDLTEQGLKAGGQRRSAPNAALAMREMAHLKRLGKRKRTISLIWMVTALLLLTAALLALVFRQSISEARPGAAKVYETLGLQVSPTGIELSPVEARQVRLDGEDFLVVSGQVVNLTSEPRFAPLVEMRLLDAGADELASWTVDTGPERLAPGERRDYRTEYPNPPVDAVRLVFEMEG